MTLVCPACGSRFADNVSECPRDRTTLVPEETAGTTMIVTERLQDDATEKLEERRSVLSLLQFHNASRQSGGRASAEKYQVVGELGKGGMGQVLRVLDRDLKREVAMKMLLQPPSETGATPTQDSLLRFIEEAQATGQLEHPNIVPVHDLGVDASGRVYFTLKYVQGNSLKRVIRGRNENAMDGSTRFRQTYSPLRMIEILISICQAMAYAHSKGIIHRDLKPDNVMLGKYGEVLVMDWGLAKVIGPRDKSGSDSDETVRLIATSRSEEMSDSTMEGSIAGTPAYMSPEQAEGKISELDERTDIYALGAILYEVLTGSPPYRGGSAADVVRKVVAGPPPSIKGQKGAFGFFPIPRELVAVCERAMARRSQDRYASAAAMRDDLQAYLENRSVSAAPDTRLQRLSKWSKRNRRQLKFGALSATAVLLIVFSAWFGWHEWRLYHAIEQGRSLLNVAREQFRFKAVPASAPSSAPSGKTTDIYSGQMRRSLSAQKASQFRAAIQQALEPIRRAIDLSPADRQARALMAEANMELWRIAVDEGNTELANVTRRDVESFAPDRSVYAVELNGFGSVILTFDAADAEAFLFSFETLDVAGKDGSPQPLRLIPVPYDVKSRSADTNFIRDEKARVAAGKPVAVDRHSIFNLEPTPASKVGSAGKVIIPELDPGRYMLLVRAPGRIDVRISLRMDRLSRVKQEYILPKAEENPPGFFYMAGGEVMVGGETAGAPAPHLMKVGPAWIYHDEISMGEYGAFLQALVHGGKSEEARQRLPKDFGKNLATLGRDGELLPAESGVDAVAFAKSPVRGVSYNDAEAYVAWRGKQEGLPYRLPQDWEWEAACRGADGRKYSWGETWGKGLAVVTQGYGDMGNSMSWRWEDYEDESPWGIHNLAGGAAEWTDSLYDPNAKSQDPVFGQRTIRGNAWALPPVGLECAFRTSGQPDYFHPTIGFRMSLDHPYTRTGPVSSAPAAGHQH